MTDPAVRHDEARRRFVVVVEGQEAFLDYAVVDDKTVDFLHTFTPHGLRGRGIAALVVAAALAWARAEGKTVVPSCWYVSDYLAKERK